MQRLVAEADALQRVEAIVVKERAAQGGHAHAMAVDLRVVVAPKVELALGVADRRSGGEALLHDAEQRRQAVVQVVAVLRVLGVQRRELEVAKALEAVALAVGVRLHRHRAEFFAARLDVEQEQEAIEPGQRIARQRRRKRRVGVERLLLLATPMHGLIGEDFERAPNAMLEVARDGKRVLVAVLVERVVKADARVGREHVLVQEPADRFERVGFAAAEELVKREPEQLALQPLVALCQHRLIAGQQQHPARAAARDRVGAEQRVVEQFAPRGFGERCLLQRRGDLRVRRLTIERVVVVCARRRERSVDDPEIRAVVAL